MAELRNYQTRVANAGTRADASIDEGLRAYMLKVYNLMALGLAITGLAAFGTMMLATTNDPAAAVATLGNGKMLTSLGVALYGSPLQVGRHARAARHGVLPERPRPHDERLGCADRVLGLRRPDGPVAVVDLPGLHRRRASCRPSSSRPPPSARCRSTATRPSAT